MFFVSLGGFDTHDRLVQDHPGLMAQVGSAMAAFYNATVEMGVANQVTAFTASDFGRTLVSNGSGSDHGWGGMQFVVGGSVLGKSFVGNAPEVANNGANDVGQGRLLPELSVDQFGWHAGQLVWRVGGRPGAGAAQPGELQHPQPGLHGSSLTPSAAQPSRARCRATCARTCAGAVPPSVLRALSEPRRLSTS